MPYRRLPNTDTARIKAIKTAIEKSEKTDYKDLQISTKTLLESKTVLNQFEILCSRYRRMQDIQVKANKSFQGKVKNARMYISHFVQVLYMSVVRSEIKESHLEYYNLETANMVVPDLTSNELILEWGKKIVDGENERISKGGVPIYNPSIAKVNVMFSLFKEGYQTQKLHQKSTLRVMDDVSAYREKVDKVIFDIWEEVEKNSLEMPTEKRLDRNKEYGIVYYYRKGEIAE